MSKAKKARRKAAAEERNLSTPAGSVLLKDALSLSGWVGGATASGASVTPDRALRVAAVYACVTLIADSISMLPTTLYRRQPKGSREPAVDVPLYHTLRRRPNPWQTTAEWLQMMAGHLLLRGAAYSRIVSQVRSVDALVPLHPDRVTPFWAPDGSIAYRYQPEAGPAEVLLQSEVHVWRGFSGDPTKPLSPIRLHAEAIGLALATEEHGARLFGQGTQVAGVLKAPGAISDAAFEHLRQSWAERYQGVGNAHKPVILEEGLEWQKIGLTADESQFLETRRYQRGEIASIYRVPPHMIGDMEKTSAWGTGVEQLSIGYVTYTLQPHITRIEQAMERDLLTEREQRDLFVKLEVAALLRGDMKAQADYYARALGGPNNPAWMTVAEVRALQDLNWLGDATEQLYQPASAAAGPSNPAPEPAP